MDNKLEKQSYSEEKARDKNRDEYNATADAYD